MSDLRDKRQREIGECYVNSNKKKGILNVAPRVGKCRIGIHIFNDLDVKNILIAYPDTKIKKAWEEEFVKMNYKGNITFTTHLSLGKYIKNTYDIVVIDEIHLLSEKQIANVQELDKVNTRILGLTGTLSSWTQRTLAKTLGLNVLAEYSIEQAIEEGIVTDYEIRIKRVELDSKLPIQFKKSKRTEKAQFKALTSVIQKLEIQNKDTKFLRLARMRLIQGSIAKIEATKSLLEELKDERVLVFCGTTKAADSLGCPVYHSKKGKKESFEDFANGKGNHQAVVKIGNTGVTYKPLDRVIINYFDSNGENLAQKINRCMAMEYNNPEKKSIVYIVTTDEPVELAWLDKALEFFDEDKIIYI